MADLWISYHGDPHSIGDALRWQKGAEINHLEKQKGGSLEIQMGWLIVTEELEGGWGQEQDQRGTQ